jgi:hypothetical protein
VVDGFRPSSRVHSTLGGRLRGSDHTCSAIPPSVWRRLATYTECQWEPRSSWGERAGDGPCARSHARPRTACTRLRRAVRNELTPIYASAGSLASIASVERQSTVLPNWPCCPLWATAMVLCNTNATASRSRMERECRSTPAATSPGEHRTLQVGG